MLRGRSGLRSEDGHRTKSMNETALASERPFIEFLTEEQRELVKGGGLYKRLNVSEHVWVKGCYIGPSSSQVEGGEEDP
jgi:hypothetical protein